MQPVSDSHNIKSLSHLGLIFYVLLYRKVVFRWFCICFIYHMQSFSSSIENHHDPYGTITRRMDKEIFISAFPVNFILNDSTFNYSMVTGLCDFT